MNVELEYSNNLNFKAKTRQFQDILIDEPKSFHGNDLGPSPVEYFLIGVGGCVSSTFVYCLKKKGIKIESMNVLVDGKLKHKEPSMYLRIKEINIEIKYSLKGDYTPETLKKCEKEFIKYCPLYEPLINGINISIVLKK